MLITVIIPTMGKPQLRYIVEHIRTYTTAETVEILIVDDRKDKHGSAPLLSDRDDVRILQGPRKGYGGPARNVAIKEARGAWIQFVDDDDFLHPKTFQWLHEAVQKAPDADVIVWRTAGLFDHIPPTFAIPPKHCTTIQLGWLTNSFAVRKDVAPLYGEVVLQHWIKPNVGNIGEQEAEHGVTIAGDEDLQYIKTCMRQNLNIYFGHKLAYGVRQPPPPESEDFPLIRIQNKTE